MQFSLDDTLKAVQIVFYIVAGIIAVLTYLAARRGWLNPTHTEFQKRVMDRLATLADELYSEFNPASEDYLTDHNGLQQALALIHNHFEQSHDDILAAGEWEGWVLLPRDTLRFQRTLEPVRSDPFIPDNIRSVVIDLLERRLAAFSEISNLELLEYRNALACGKIKPDENNWLPIMNRINTEMAKRKCGPAQIETSVHEIRGLIQEYFDAFNPHGRRSANRRGSCTLTNVYLKRC